LHTEKVNSDIFTTDLHRFIAVCRVVRELPRARLGAVGARPNAFNTRNYFRPLASALVQSTFPKCLEKPKS
jgi:L-fucose isomerase-like protein